MKFVCTAKGFYKEKLFNPETYETTYVFTDKIREARSFTHLKSAKKFLNKLNEPGFIWKPMEQEPLKDLYEVVKADSVFFTDSKPYYAVKSAKMINTSDVAFLSGNKKYNPERHFSYEEAVDICNTKNTEIIQAATKALIVK